MPVCVLTCCRVYGGLQGKKMIKNRPKIADFAPKSLKSNLVHLYCAANVENNDGDWYASMICGLFRVAKLSASQKLLFEWQIGPFCP